jgi:hypothetical protein
LGEGANKTETRTFADLVKQPVIAKGMYRENVLILALALGMFGIHLWLHEGRYFR